MFVAPHLFKHLQELETNASNKYSPDYRFLLGQIYLQAINYAIEHVMLLGPIEYDKMYDVDRHEIMFGAPRNEGDLPAVKHFQ